MRTSRLSWWILSLIILFTRFSPLIRIIYDIWMVSLLSPLLLLHLFLLVQDLLISILSILFSLNSLLSSSTLSLACLPSPLLLTLLSPMRNWFISLAFWFLSPQCLILPPLVLLFSFLPFPSLRFPPSFLFPYPSLSFPSLPFPFPPFPSPLPYSKGTPDIKRVQLILLLVFVLLKWPSSPSSYWILPPFSTFPLPFSSLRSSSYILITFISWFPPLPSFLFPLYPFISTILMIIKMGEPYFITLYQSILSYLYFLLFSIQYFPLPPLSTYLPLPSLPLPLQ